MVTFGKGASPLSDRVEREGWDGIRMRRPAARRISSNSAMNINYLSSQNHSRNPPYNGIGSPLTGRTRGRLHDNKDGVVRLDSETIDMRKVILPERAHDCRCANGILHIPEGIEGIIRAFRANDDVRRVELPDGFRYIGESAFNCCNNLMSVEFPNTLVEIGEHAFASCPKLENVVLPNGLKKIDSYAFAHCHGLKRITIPPSVDSLGCGIFCKCLPDLTFVVQAGSPIFGYLLDIGSVRLELQCWDDAQAETP